MDELIENLNPEDVIIDNSNIINEDNCSLEIEQIGRRAYINSTRGRSDLLADCTQFNRMDLYDEVMSVWGDTPTIVEPEETPKTLEQLKEEKCNELESEFNQYVKGSFTTTEGYEMQFNTDDSLKMFGAIQLMEANNVTTGYITDANDETHYNIDLVTMKSVQKQMLEKFAEAHLKKQQYRAAIAEAENIEELNQINIDFNK